MPGPLDILSHTPWWVWLVLGVLVVTGAQALRPRRVVWWRLVFVPVVFAVWGLLNLAASLRDNPPRAAIWLALAVPGALLARRVWRRRPMVIEGGMIERPGSALPLLRNVGIFLAKYAIGVTLGVAGALGATTVVSAAGLVDGAFSGLLAGYFFSGLAALAGAVRAART